MKTPRVGIIGIGQSNFTARRNGSGIGSRTVAAVLPHDRPRGLVDPWDDGPERRRLQRVRRILVEREGPVEIGICGEPLHFVERRRLGRAPRHDELRAELPGRDA